MAIQSFDVYIATLALFFVVGLFWRSRPPLPPGPPGWPLIGNLLDVLSSESQYKTLGAMTSKYGPIIFLRVMGTQFVFLNSFQATKDILEKKGLVTSSRPHHIVGGDLVGWSNLTAFVEYGDTHRRHRKILGQHIGTNSSLVTFRPTQEAEARRFILCVSKNSDGLTSHCQRTVASLILRATRGYGVKDNHDPLVEMGNRALCNITETMFPGRFIADFFPILRYLPEWFPGGGFHKDAKRWRKMATDAVNKPHEIMLENLAKGDALPSLSSCMLQKELTPEDEENLKWCCLAAYLGGTSTMPSMLSAFFLAMTIYPEIFKKAQAEVDAIVGNDRLPTMKDREALPYVNAVLTELFRWNVPIPLPAHASTEDIEHEGYLIPKGSLLCPNIWFILSNPETYPDPERFDPERFLGEHQQADPRKACFGWGRRVCPGARLAESMLFIHVAMALSTLNVSRCIENGVECVPKYEFEEGMIRRAKPFKCRIALRSQTAEELLRA